MCSRGKQDLERLRNLVPAFDHVSQYLKGNRLHLAHGLFFAGAVGHYAGKVRHRSEDSTILLPIQFNADWLNFNHGYALYMYLIFDLKISKLGSPSRFTLRHPLSYHSMTPLIASPSFSTMVISV